MKPPACPECDAPRHRLYYCWRRVHGYTEETWGCAKCAATGAWRLATAPVLDAVVRVTYWDLKNDRERARVDEDLAALGIVHVPPGPTSRERIRELFRTVEIETVHTEVL